MPRPLNSDELGAKGEKRLAELLLDARLTPNSPDRDRVGWDCVVTWPLDKNAPLDSRPAPLAVHIQLKTIWAGNDSVSLNLGTLEFIVKDARPAFLLVLEVDPTSLSFVRARIIHIADDFLAEILKRLRQAQVIGKPSNELEFEPSPAKWGIELPAVSGAALRLAMESVIPSGMDEYGRYKLRQLSELGFERGGLMLSGRIEADSHDELIDGFLGLRLLRVTDAKQYETRFDIPIEVPGLPWDGDQGWAPVKIKARRTDRCVVVVNNGANGKTLEMKAEFFIVPPSVTGPGRVVLEARAILVRIRVDVGDSPAGPGGAVTFSSVEGLSKIRATPTDWISYFRLGAWSIRDPVTVELRTKRIIPPPPIEAGGAPMAELAHAANYEKMAEVAEVVEWALSAAHSPGTRLTWAQLLAAAPDLVTLRMMKLSPQDLRPVSFRTSNPVKPAAPGSYEMLYINSVPIADEVIAFASRTRVSGTAEGDTISWITGSMQLEFVRKINGRRSAMRKFVREAQKYAGITDCFGPGVVPGDTAWFRERRLKNDDENGR